MHPAIFSNEISDQTPKQDKSPPERKQSGLKSDCIRGLGVGQPLGLSLAPPAGGKLDARKQDWVPGYNCSSQTGASRLGKNSLDKARIWRDKDHPVICEVPAVGLPGPF